MQLEGQWKPIDSYIRPLILEDHGAWEDPAQYFASGKYRRLIAVQSTLYPVLALLANHDIKRIRAGTA
jgi:hypothetical protein